MAKKTKTEVESTPQVVEPLIEKDFEEVVVETPVVEEPKARERIKPTNEWEIKDRMYLLRGGINDAAGSSAIRGVIIPAGTSTVYDQRLGSNMKRPFLHVRYRASQTDDRRMKSWVTGSVGAATSALDAMQIHMLSERCLITQGANNFMLIN